MNEHKPYLINIPIDPPKNRFPILVQLGILMFILAGLFGGLFFSKDSTATIATEINYQSYPTDNETYPISANNLQKFDNITIRAKSAYVWDVRTQRALYSKNADEILPLASITKLMTSILAHELIDETEKTSVPLSAVQQEGSSGLSAGEKLNIKSLLELALISSSNDAAFTLGASVGKLLGDNDPTTQFVQGMNIRAEELNLHSLKFWNTTGLDLSPTEPGAVGSAKDISFLMEYIINNYPDLIDETQIETMRVYNAVGEYHDISNTNEIVEKIPNLIGSKTGYTDLAGGNLTIAFNAGLDRPIIVTVLGSTREERFSDVLKLVNAVQSSVSSE